MDLNWNPHAYLGYTDTFQPNKYHTSDLQGPIMQFQSAPEGLGLNARAMPNGGLFTVGAQYGMKIPHTPLTITPSAGMAYVPEPMRELPLKHPFSLGISASMPLGEKLKLMAEYLHMSNAGQKQPNIGMDMGSVMLGYPF